MINCPCHNIYFEFFYSRDPRFNDETTAYTRFLRTSFPPPSDITIKAIRERSEALHKKVNENLIGTFKGKEEEKTIRINSTTGRILITKIFIAIFNEWILVIPITIYTPVDVKKDKMVIFFHGGGKYRYWLRIVSFQKYTLLGWSMNSRKTHQTIVNMLAEYLTIDIC